MIRELGFLFDGLPADATADRYHRAIVDENMLGKPTRSSRLKTAQYLASLYALDPSAAVFRLLRHLWDSDSTGRPMLAFLAATARDPLLRECSEDLLGVTHGQAYTATAIALGLSQRHPARLLVDTGRLPDR
jgi:hypothetical protein